MFLNLGLICFSKPELRKVKQKKPDPHEMKIKEV